MDWLAANIQIQACRSPCCLGWLTAIMMAYDLFVTKISVANNADPGSVFTFVDHLVKPFGKLSMAKKETVKDLNAEQKIIEAAKKVFKEKGYTGARTQLIANEAGISKPLLHYYFRSKELLFERVFDEEVNQLVIKLTPILDAPIEDWEESVRLRIYTFIEYFEQDNAFFFILREVHQNPELAELRKKQFRNKKNNRLMEFFEQLVSEKRIRSFQPGFLYMFMQSICSYPLINATLFKHGLRMSDAEFQKYMTGYKKEAADFFISAIKK